MKKYPHKAKKINKKDFKECDKIKETGTNFMKLIMKNLIRWMINSLRKIKLSQIVYHILDQNSKMPIRDRDLVETKRTL